MAGYSVIASGMAALSQTIRAALRASPTGWPGELTKGGHKKLEGALADLPSDVRDAVLAGLVDPEQVRWALGAMLGLSVLDRAGAQPLGMASDEVIELTDAQGLTFGLAPSGVVVPASPMGRPEDVAALLASLDNIFGERGYGVHIGQPLPDGVDLAPVSRAVRLWLSDLGRGTRHERNATYEGDGIRIDLALFDEGGGKGRVLTLGPVDALERLHAVERQLIDAMARHEQSLGSLPLVVALTSDRTWLMPRGYVQLQLYGNPNAVVATSGSEERYDAWFPGRGSALFHDRTFQHLASLWWLAPTPHSRKNPLAGDLKAYDNPWASQMPCLDGIGPRFSCVELEARRAAHMRWVA